MSSSYTQGILAPYDPVNAGLVPVDIWHLGLVMFMDQNPIISRAPQAPLGSLSFKLFEAQDRPKTYTVNVANGANNSTTSLVLDSSGPLIPGDVLETAAGEYVLVTANTLSTNTLTITRGYAGTTAANVADDSTMYLVGNSRTGAEIDQSAAQPVDSSVEQYAQTFQHPYQVGGAVESASNMVLPTGINSPVELYRMHAMRNVLQDMERAALYGKGVALAASTTRPGMKGLRELITTNKILSGATNASAYKPSDFYRDVIYPCVENSGNPGVCFVSPDWGKGFMKWNWAFQRVDPGADTFGVRFRAFYAPFAEDILVIPDPQLRAGTAVCLTPGEFQLRVKRAMFDKPRGSRGDATEGDIIAESAIELQNESHHSWVAGITGWAVES